ncbi:MAG: hypothetical protein PWP70_1140, partial [Moorella sp. (in: firmicutes)]|nr:hypothetical protein [Moorella sp. (in: firmicutes)]
LKSIWIQERLTNSKNNKIPLDIIPISV